MESRSHLEAEFGHNYSYRRITVALQRAGWVVNRKRVLRLMQADTLLCLRKRAFVRTTDSDHELQVYPNLARELQVTGLNQLWVADITYIRLSLSFVYLAVILNPFSPARDWLGVGSHARGRKLARAALRMAIAGGRVALKVSITRSGCTPPWDNCRQPSSCNNCCSGGARGRLGLRKN